MAREKRSLSTYTDRFGHTIGIGSFVVYANAIGRASKTAIGQVLELKETTDRYDRARISIRLASVQADTWTTQKPYVRNVWLQEVERVLLYPNDLIPKRYRDLIAAGEKPRNER